MRHFLYYSWTSYLVNIILGVSLCGALVNLGGGSTFLMVTAVEFLCKMAAVFT
jgi:hypothetical protein